MPALKRDDASAAFFDATARGELLIRKAADGSFYAPETPFDPVDPAGDFEWVAASGTGTLVSWIVPRARPGSDGQQAIVGVTGLVELDEGPWVFAPLVDVDVEALAVGARLRVVFPPVEEGEVAPAFTGA